MKRPRMWISAACVAAAVMALSGATTDAAAASVVKISYTVTGGTFYGDHTGGGPITSGNVSYASLVPSGVSTPNVWNTQLFVLTALTLSGPNGYFRIVDPGNPTIQTGTIDSNNFFIQSRGMRSYISAHGPGGPTWYAGPWTIRLNQYGMRAENTSTITTLDHTWTVGNEVRTYATIVPEPATAPLVGLALLGLSGYAARQRGRRNAGKA